MPNYRCRFLSQKMATKRKRSTPLRVKRPLPELMEEIVTEILVLLPVKSLLRFRSVCKAWRSVISDPAFIRAHLHHSAAKRDEQDACFIISPHTLDYRLPEELNRWPTTFSTHIRFYQWQRPPQGKKHRAAAKFLHDKNFAFQFNQVLFFAHCDGLVFAPTDTTLYVYNPATRDFIALPDTGRGNLIPRRRTTCYCSGIGFDRRRTGKYKVVQAFYRDIDVMGHTSMGMDVFTLCSRSDDGCWREMASDPPYPLYRWQTAVSIDAYMFWRLADNLSSSGAPRGLVHVSLEDEVFGITMLPDSLEPEDEFMMDVLPGRELCITAFTSETILTIWTLAVAVDGVDGSEWARVYKVRSSILCHTMALPQRILDGDKLILWRDHTIYGYDVVTCKMTTLCDMSRMRYQGRRERKWKDLFFFNVNPYTESLVRVNNPI